MATVRYVEKTLKILDTEQNSAAQDVRASLPVALVIPATFDGTTLDPQGSLDGTNFLDVYDDAGNKIVITAGVSRWIFLLPQEYAGFNSLRFVSDAAQAGADADLTLILRAE